jgi:hypothetical protein
MTDGGGGGVKIMNTFIMPEGSPYRKLDKNLTIVIMH